MRKIVFLFVTVLLFNACKDNKASNDKMLLDSSGNINNVSVIIENDLWNGQVGEAIRNVLTAPVYGLPQDEPLFTLSQIPPSVFSGFVTRNRTILQIIGNKPANIEFTKNIYAQPQKVISISGQSKQEIIDIVNANAKKIVETFRNAEIAERQRQMKKSPHPYTSIKEKLGLTIEFASAYRIAKETDNFFWIRKDITTGTSNLLIYSLPFGSIKPNDSTVTQIIKIRDSIGEKHIEGGVEGTYMVTENAYTPFFKETILDNKPAFETKGIWDLKNGFMGGPFINYAVEDKINKRWVIIEGFAFAPSVEKRDYMLELESIIKSVKIE